MSGSHMMEIRRLTLTSVLALGLSTPLFGLSSTYTSEIWIADRTDGVAGTGTKADPYDGSTAAKLGAIFAAAPTHCLINVGSGTYKINEGTVALKDYQQLVGAGQDSTTFLMEGVVPGPGGQGYYTCISSPFANNNSIIISNLTCNGNASAWAPAATNGKSFTVGGMALYGNNITIQSCRVTDMGGNKQEAFPILMEVIGANNPCHFLVKDCDVDNTYFCPLGATAIIFARSSATNGIPMNGDESSNGQVEHCYIYDGGNIGCAGFFNMTVSNCFSDNRGTNCWGSWNSDTCTNANITIQNNTFYTGALQYANCGSINVGGAGPFYNYKILNNQFYITANGTLTGAVSFQANVINSTVSGNTISPVPGTSVTSDQRPLIINGGGNSHFTLTNNISDMNYAPTDNVDCGLTVTGGGSGYTSAPTGKIVGGGGAGAAVEAYIDMGVVVAVYITDGGSGYTSAPTIMWSGGGGGGVTVKALNVLNGAISGNFFTTASGNKHTDGTPTLYPPQPSN